MVLGLLRALLVAAASSATSVAAACPRCPAGQRARQQVVERDFETNLLAAAAPFLVIGAVARYAERRGGR